MKKLFVAEILIAVMSILVLAGSSQIWAQDIECATVVTPEQVEFELSRGSVLSEAQVDDTTHYWIPIAIHIVRRDDGSGGFNYQRTIETMRDLNDQFEQLNFSFFLFRDFGGEIIIDYIDDDNLYFGSNWNLLRSINVVPNAINTYFVPSPPFCGLSSFSAGGVQGIVMNNSCAGEGNPSTFAHEVGHYFNLYHTHETAFGGECPDGRNCLTAGDLLCDTPADPNLSGLVNGLCEYIGTGTAGGICGSDLYTPQVESQMSYAPKLCRDFFSPNQITKMRAALPADRPELLDFDSTDTDGDGVMNVADNCLQIYNPEQIDADLDGHGDICLYAVMDAVPWIGNTPLTVQFDGSSSLNVSSWNWQFGDDSVSSEQSPAHTYYDIGPYQVTLDVATDSGNFTAIGPSLVFVTADTLIASVAGADENGDARVDIYSRNTLPFYAVTIPFSWSGSSGIFLDSASTAGTRIEHFAQSGLIVVDPFTLRAVFSATSFLQGADSLVSPDSGLILSLYFSVSPSSDPVDVPIVGFGGYSPLFFAEVASYNPVGVAGSVAPIIFTCGDANGSGEVEIGDAIFLIKYIFSDEAPPVPLEAGDANGSGEVEIGDAIFLIKYIFSDGPDPQCF